MQDSFDADENPFEGLQILSTDTAEDLAELLRWKHEVLRPWQKPRQSIEAPKPEQSSALTRRERSRKGSK